MRRRNFIALLGGTAVAWPLVGRAQQSMPVIGFLTAARPYAPLLDEFRKALAESGYYDGQNVTIQYRSAEGQYDRLSGFAAELVRARVDVIVTAGGSISVQTAKAATNAIPIVALLGDDPIGSGLVDSLHHPGGNVTGVAQLVEAAEGKRLEFLRELLPTAETIAFLVNPAFPRTEMRIRNIESVAQALGVKLLVLRASNDYEIAAAFATITQARVGGLVVGADAFFFIQRDQLVALSERNAVPTMYFFREFATAGGLTSYGTSLTDAYRQIGVYTAKILKGARPADLPVVEQSEKIELVINLRTAKALKLTVPQSLLARADEVIE
jgi:putative ABC transport system substrate-binding protein